MKSRMNLIITILLLLCFATPIFADLQTVSLNTGFNHANNLRYVRPPVPWIWQLPGSVNHKDEYWTLIYDPSTNGGTPVPRQSDMMPYVTGAWRLEMQNSEWIAFERNGIPTNNGKSARVYVFEKCFCLKQGFDKNDEGLKKTTMDLQLRADDWAVAYLNQPLAQIIGQPIPPPPYLGLGTGIYSEPNSILKISNTGGGFSNPTPARTTLSGSALIKRLQVGRNCLQVKLYDLGLAVSGFNLIGSITAQGIDEVAKFNPNSPNQQFSQCSSCFNKKKLDANTVFDSVDKIKNNVRINPDKP